MIADTPKRSVRSCNITLTLNYDMPNLHQINCLEKPQILTLPTYDLDEAKIADASKILEEIMRPSYLILARILTCF